MTFVTKAYKRKHIFCLVKSNTPCVPALTGVWSPERLTLMKRVELTLISALMTKKNKTAHDFYNTDQSGRRAENVFIWKSVLKV